MAKKRKYYVVWHGVEPGIYDQWDKCKAQIAGFPGAKYKSFKSLSEAEDAFASGPDAAMFKTRAKKKRKPSYHEFLDEIVTPSMCVDAACSGNPGVVEYQGVDTETKDVFFRIGPLKKGTNNIGEFLALIHALAYLQGINDHSLPIYSDSRTALSWYRNKKVKTTFFDKHKNPELRKLLNRAIEWMKSNNPKNPILKWDTEKWGEIPADFGRK